MGKRFFEKRTDIGNRTTISILFPDENTVQSLFTVGETKKIEPITAMAGIPLPVIDPECGLMLQVTVQTDEVKFFLSAVSYNSLCGF